MTMILSTRGLKQPERAATICGTRDIFFYSISISVSTCLDELRHVGSEGGGAYHIPSDVLEVLVFSIDCGQDEQLEDH